MNYRHAYHAGNFADVMKHLAVAMIVDYLKKKDSPFCVIDAHGGSGLYDLYSDQAQKTGEWTDGIARFADAENFPPDFAIYYDQVRQELGHGRYPGSPRIVQKMLRPDDRLIANELHPEDVEDLKDALHWEPNIRVTNLDAYECLRANLPPKEKRGFILIDPPFEKKDEFQILTRQMEEWKKRFANGIYAIWYPIKAHLEVDDLKAAARALDLPRTWCLETLLHPRDQETTLNGCGLILFNVPYQVPERLVALMPLLSQKMGLFQTPSEWITPA